MSTVDLPVLAVGTYDQWVLGAGASKVAALNADDSDTSYLYAGTGEAGGYAAQTFTLDCATLPGGIMISEVRLFCKARCQSTSASMAHRIRMAAADTDSSNFSPTVGSYSSHEWAPSRPGGGDWQRNDLVSLEIGGKRMSGGSGGTILWTYEFVRVTYEFAGGWFASFRC